MSKTVLDKKRWDALLAAVSEGLMVRTDSREVREGDVFVAISGPLRDGADFVPQALEKGAAYIVCATEVDCGSAELILHPSPVRLSANWPLHTSKPNGIKSSWWA